jgi:hypothetical protein
MKPMIKPYVVLAAVSVIGCRGSEAHRFAEAAHPHCCGPCECGEGGRCHQASRCGQALASERS